MRKLLAALALCLCVTTTQADLFEDADAAYFRGDYATALRLFRPLAEIGHAAAQYNLGVMYRKGEGTPQDYSEALKWYRLAAERGHAAAQNNVGYMYDKGQGTPQDYVEAHKYFNLAASRHTDEEKRNQSAENRDLVEEKMTSAQVAEAQKLAREWDKAHPR